MDQRIAFLEAENAVLRTRLESLGTEPGNVVVLDDGRVHQDAGSISITTPLKTRLPIESDSMT